MRKLLNTLYVTTEDAYASLDGDNIVIKKGEEKLGQYPLLILESIYLFTYAGASPALMGKCTEKSINLVFLTPYGRFLARAVGMENGNVLLRRMQYRIADDPGLSCRIAKYFIFGKVSNARSVLQRMMRDHAPRIDMDKFEKGTSQLKILLEQILQAENNSELRGYEGTSAEIYFARFDDMVLQNKNIFFFHSRNRRPPLDNVNALLSFVYMMLTSECTAALEAVGLDPYVGFMHTDRPGRQSLALDLMEELRPCMADRFALTLINDRILNEKDFKKQENGAVFITKEGRKKVQQEWQTKKKTEIKHPYLEEKIEWGLIPYVQAMLLARYIRNDLDGYPPFLWK